MTIAELCNANSDVRLKTLPLCFLADFRNVKTAEARIMQFSLYVAQRPLFLVRGNLLWALATFSRISILKSLASANAEILKGTPKFWEAPLV